MLRGTSLIVSLFLVAACAGTPSGGNGGMSFPATSKTTFGRSSCSPVLGENEEQGLAVTMPKQIIWGEPLPICGYLRVGAELRIKYPQFNFILERRDQRLAAYRSTQSQELGDPMIDKSSPAYELLKQHGELYFNVDGQHPFRDLSPGEYDIVISYLDQFRTEKQHLTVVAGGWRGDLSTVLLDMICDGAVLADLSEYFGLVHRASLVDTDAGGQASLDPMLEVAWRNGFAKYKGKVTDRYASKLASLNAVDQTIALYVYSTSQLKCGDKHLEVESVLNLFGGIRRWEVVAAGTAHASSAPRR